MLQLQDVDESLALKEYRTEADLQLPEVSSQLWTPWRFCSAQADWTDGSKNVILNIIIYFK